MDRTTIESRCRQFVSALGREALASVEASYMAAFSDLEIRWNDTPVAADRAVFNWTFLGVHSDPHGTGKRVRVRGMGVWDLGPEGLIATSRGYYDTATFARQGGDYA